MELPCTTSIYIFVCVFGLSLGYPDYVPSMSCFDMFPAGHFVDAMDHVAATRVPPYLITANATSYSPGDVIEVHVNSTQPMGEEYSFYKGVFVQARKADCDMMPVGTFFLRDDEDLLTLRDCAEMEGKSVRHMKKGNKTESTFYWRAPSVSVGHIYFRGTIAKNKTHFWTNVFSEFIEDTNSTSDAPTSYCPTVTNIVLCPTVTPPKEPSGASTSYVSIVLLFICSYIRIIHQLI